MRKRITILFLIIVCTCTITGCGKDIDKMTDEEVYDYLSVMTESELEKATSHMTEAQQRRAAMVLTLMEAQDMQERDNFENGLSLPIYENTDETEQN